MSEEALPGGFVTSVVRVAGLAAGHNDLSPKNTLYSHRAELAAGLSQQRAR